VIPAPGQPTTIPTGPTPTSTAVGTGRTPDGRVFVAIEMRTATGPLTYFLSAEHAAAFGQQVVDQAREVASGIVVASAADMPPAPTNGQS
jgi:hypothetical protein